MTQEEKAKAYDKALKVLHKYDGANIMFSQDLKEEMFPQLKESEDEKIRKNIISWLKNIEGQTIPVDEYNSALAWLEKRGEQKPAPLELKAGHWYICHRAFCCRADHLTVKEGERFMCEKDGIVKGFVMKEPEKYFKEVCAPAPMEDEQKPSDKVEPKFEIGNWVVYDHRAYQVVELPKEGYINLGLRGNGKIEFAPSTYCRPWTIQDTKDGDVLACESCEYLLFKSFSNTDGRIKLYCWYNGQANNFHVNIDVKLKQEANIHPATQEQRALFFQKMKEAGYEWDADKKELKKIEVKPTPLDCEEICDNAWKDFVKRWNEEAEKYHDAWLERIKGAVSEKTKAQKQEWSEEDEIGFRDAMWAIEQARTIAKDENDMGNIWYAEHWLKSLKDRVQPQSKQEWSEEDKEWLYDIISSAEQSAKLDKEQISWLKSLKERFTWKPSDEQMATFWDAICNLSQDGYKWINDMKSIYQDLKKLREE